MTELLNLPFITEGVERSTFHYDTPEFNLLISEVGKRFPDNEKVDCVEIVSSRCGDLLAEFIKTMGDYSSFLNTYLTMYSVADDTNHRTKIVRNEKGKVLSIEFDSFSKDLTKTTSSDNITSITIRPPACFFQEEVKLLTPQAIAPVRSTTYAACKDLFTPVDIDIAPGCRQLIKTGVAIAWNDPDYYMQLLPRSSIAYKSWTDVKAGVIDYDYRKEIGVILHNNHLTDHFVAKAGDRIAQYAYIKIKFDTSSVVDEFTLPLESNRVGGFGSTNV